MRYAHTPQNKSGGDGHTNPFAGTAEPGAVVVGRSLPQILKDQLTLFQLGDGGGQIIPHPTDFQTSAVSTLQS